MDDRVRPCKHISLELPSPLFIVGLSIRVGKQSNCDSTCFSGCEFFFAITVDFPETDKYCSAPAHHVPSSDGARVITPDNSTRSLTPTEVGTQKSTEKRFLLQVHSGLEVWGVDFIIAMILILTCQICSLGSMVRVLRFMSKRLPVQIQTVCFHLEPCATMIS